MNFEAAHRLWLDDHLERRSGERKGRLERGHQHAETLYLRNVWWPLHEHLNHLHPEYEVLDWRGRSYFADFAWLPGYTKILFEIKGFNTHVRDMDRNAFCHELNRETFLYSMGYNVISIGYDDVAHHPELCKTLLRLILSRVKPEQTSTNAVALIEKEIILLAFQLARFIRPKDVIEHLPMNFRTAVRYLRSLCAKGWLRPVQSGSGIKVLGYELIRRNLEASGW